MILKEKEMNISVMSRNEAKKASYKGFDKKTIIISITDVGSKLNTFKKQNLLLDVLHIQFDDVEAGEKNCISSSDAENIIGFVNKYLNDAEECIVHCEAGISRSAGIAAALLYILNGTDNQIFGNSKYCPNRTCYRAILNNFYGSYSDAEIDIKFKDHFKEWIKKHLDL